MAKRPAQPNRNQDKGGLHHPQPASRDKRGKNASANTKHLPECFTIMPFGDWFDDYYNDVYKCAIEESGLRPLRADDLYRPSAIVNDIWELTKRAKVVLADLTGKNPNVFYELGLAHALGKPAVLVTQSIADVPFDLRALRVIEYDKNDPTWGIVLKENIKTSLAEVLQSPGTAVLPTFLNSPNQGTRKPREGRSPLVESLRSEVDRLRSQLMESERASQINPGLVSIAVDRLGAEDPGSVYDWLRRDAQLAHRDAQSILSTAMELRRAHGSRSKKSRSPF